MNTIAPASGRRAVKFPVAPEGPVPTPLAPALREAYQGIAPFLENAVFIAGLGRSGTTLLLRLIDGHPDAFVVPHESMVLTHYLPDYEINKDPAAVSAGIVGRLSRMMRKEKRRQKAADFLRQAIPLRLAKPGAPRTIFADLLACLALEQSPAGRKLWLEKTPKNEFHLATIFANFPDARIIFNVRDPRAAYASNLKRKDVGMTAAAFVRGWVQRIQVLLTFLAENPTLRKRVLVTRYEDYVATPEVEMPRIFRFLGIDDSFEAHPTMFGSAWKGNSFDPRTDTPGRLDNAKIDKWRSEVSAADIATINGEAAFEMSLVGYRD